MIKFTCNVKDETIEILLNAKRGDDRAVLEFLGPFEAAQELEQWLSRQRGAYGHFIESVTTPVDLHAALSRPAAKAYSPELIEGASLVEGYPSPPSGKAF